MTDSKNDLVEEGFVVLLILIFMDITLTWYGLSHGFTEQNPMLAFSMFKIGLTLTMILMIILSNLLVFLLWLIKDAHERNTISHMLFFINGWKLCVVMSWIGVLI